MAPMSMPSSREVVATSAGRWPALSSSSISTRCSRAIEPWWARTSSSPASSLRRWARLGEAAAVGEHDGALVLADELEDPRVDGRPDAAPGLRVERRLAGCSSSGSGSPSVVSVDRDDDLEASGYACAGIDDCHLAAWAGAAEEAGDGFEWALGGGSGRCAAASRLPRRRRCSSCSRLSARCAPRLLPAIA